MITLKGVGKIYRAGKIEKIALDDIDLTVAKGEFVAIMGPSGCGKSTLLNVIGMNDQPTSGSYEFGGTDVAQYSEAQLVKLRKAQIGFVFQSFNLLDEISVEDNIALPLRYLGLSAQERRNRARKALALVGLTEQADYRPLQLSGGQQQQAAIARAIAAEPALLLADEPTGNLDSKKGEEVMELLARLNKQGATIILVTHSERNATHAGRVIHMLDGRIVPADARQSGAA